MEDSKLVVSENFDFKNRLNNSFEWNSSGFLAYQGSNLRNKRIKPEVLQSKSHVIL